MNAQAELASALSLLRIVATGSIDVEFGHFTIEADYEMHGSYWPATETSPAEYPYVSVKRCRIRCGNFIGSAAFPLLPAEVQERVIDEIIEQEQT